MDNYDVIVIGGGAAGLFASFNLNGNIALLEKNDSLGKKLLMAGAGRCNISHSGDIKEFLNHYGEKYRFLKNVFSKFNNLDLIKLFKKNGMGIIEDKNGKIFPETESSKDVLEIFKNLCMKNNVRIKKSSYVESLEKKDGLFYVKTKDKLYKSKYVILTTGGKSYPTTGSSGDGYDLAKKMLHNIVEVKPALTPIYVKDFRYKDLSGLSFTKLDISLYRDGKKIKTHNGDIGFTHKGISGPGILDFSRYFMVKDTLKINFIKKEIDEFRKEFILKASENGTLRVKKFLKEEKIPESMVNKIFEKLEIAMDIKLAEIGKKLRIKLIEEITDASFLIDEIAGYNLAMVSSGGIDLKMINSKTMESKLVENLYFAGEIIDVDGDTGGYNLQAAFSTAYQAAMSINSKL